MSDARDYVISILVMGDFKAVLLLSAASKHACATKDDQVFQLEMWVQEWGGLNVSFTSSRLYAINYDPCGLVMLSRTTIFLR